VDTYYLHFSSARDAATALAILGQIDLKKQFRPITGANANHNPEYLELLADYYDSGAVGRMAGSLSLSFEVVERDRIIWPRVHPLKQTGVTA
jgi:hypothetical protein